MENLYREEDVLAKLNKSRSAWRLLIKRNEAPSPVYYGPKSPRWKESDLVEYINNPNPAYWIRKNAEKKAV